MKLLLLLLIGVGAEAGPVLGLNDKLHEAIVKARTKLAAEAKAHDDKRGRSLTSLICDDTSGLYYNTAVAIYGDALTQCLCNNNLLEDDGTEVASVTTEQACACKDEMKASETFKTVGGLSDSDIDMACTPTATVTYNIARTFAPSAGVAGITNVFTETMVVEDAVTDTEVKSATLSASAAVERQAASTASNVDSALADPAAVASIQSAVENVAGAGSVTVAVEERAPPPPPSPPPPPRAGGGGRDDGDGDGDGGSDGGGGGGVPIAAVAGGAGGGVVLLLVAGAICYCRRNKARAQTQHQTRHSAGETKAVKGAKPTAAAGRGDFV